MECFWRIILADAVTKIRIFDESNLKCLKINSKRKALIRKERFMNGIRVPFYHFLRRQIIQRDCHNVVVSSKPSNVNLNACLPLISVGYKVEVYFIISLSYIQQCKTTNFIMEALPNNFFSCECLLILFCEDFNFLIEIWILKGWKRGKIGRLWRAKIFFFFFF